MLTKRIITSVIGVPLLVTIFYLGNEAFLLAVMLLTLAGLYEFGNITKASGMKSIPVVWGAGGILFPLLFYYLHHRLFVGVALFLIFSFSFYLYWYPRYTPTDLAFALLGTFYISWGFAQFILLRAMNDGFWLIVYAFIIIWSTDTGAYFVGVGLGRHKMTPVVSPHKTWEGFAGGIVCSFLAALLLTSVVSYSQGQILLYIAPVVSLAGQMGDLFESTLKRSAGIKDSGTLIPGHGGVLDRFDSALWSVPAAVYLIMLL